MTPTERLAVALVEQYGTEALSRLLDDAENGVTQLCPGPADVPRAVARDVLRRLGDARGLWRPYPGVDSLCRPVES